MGEEEAVECLAKVLQKRHPISRDGKGLSAPCPTQEEWDLSQLLGLPICEMGGRAGLGCSLNSSGLYSQM